jgi:hypothetical protein
MSPRRKGLSPGFLAVVAGLLFISCDRPAEIVTIHLKKVVKDGKDTCHDDVDPTRVTVGQGKHEIVVWRIQNACGATKTLTFSLKDKAPVTDCGISPPKAGFATIESPFDVADGEMTNVYCTHHDSATNQSYKYTIKIAGSGPSTESHELDIGVSP